MVSKPLQIAKQMVKQEDVKASG